MRMNIVLYSCSIFIFKLTKMLTKFLKLYTKSFVQSERGNNLDVLYHSEHFLVVSKPYDMCINSNNPEKKV